MPSSPKQLEQIGEEASEMDRRVELEDTTIGRQIVLPITEDSQDPPHRSSTTEKPDLHTSTSSVAVAITTGAAIELESNPLSTVQPSRTRKSSLDGTSGEALPHLPLTTRKGDEAIALTRRNVRSPSCSILCEEEEAIFPTRKWTKPLANMGDALNWKSSVLHRFNAIQY